jgi:hypothetical protein
VALARLLLARLNHSIGSSDGLRSDGIDDLALAYRRVDEEVEVLTELYDATGLSKW